jgi:putative sterol carrier protein
LSSGNPFPFDTTLPLIYVNVNHFRPKESTMSIEAARRAITEKVGTDSGLDATLKFDCGADGAIYIDGKATPNTVTDSTAPADCTIAVTLANLEALIAGDLQPTTAFMAGKLQVEGDIAIAMRLSRVL